MPDHNYRPPTTEQLDQLLQQANAAQTEPFPDGVGIAICWDGGDFPDPGGIYRYGNLRDWDNHSMAFTDDVLFKIASCSKTFTATAYAMALQKDMIDDYTTVGDMVRPSTLGSNYLDIPLRSLVNYTSGFPADNVPGSGTLPTPFPVPYEVDEMFGFLRGNPFEPEGTTERYTYSNLAFSLLGWLLAEKIGHAKFAQLIDGWIFRPLGMNDSQYSPPYIKGMLSTEPKPPAAPKMLPRCYTYSAGDNGNDGTYELASPSSHNFDAYYGGGGVMTSPRDMLQWLRFNLGLNKNLPDSEALLQKLHTPTTGVTAGTSQLCMGWFMTPASALSPAMLYKDGDLAGANSYLLLIASDAPGQIASPAGVSVMVNVKGLTVNGTTLATWLAKKVMAIMSGEETPPV
ncbi:beta-lactamase family protein [Serratia plymuthica]|uniref:serine hydrolase domain-containing protein n=1 Tax=Serratia plymuthica TaxID=82996 RepID=UPI0018E49AE1|nr:serine hydrolase domain-containing protein [Serratia plymuthica]MBI6138484.1 beta-lactamase family protein [Serratia plymuthica]